jgi:ectoine hydrolase
MNSPSAPSIPADEYRLRQARAATDARERGLDGLLVWGACGSGLDAYGNVFYLTNHYSPVPRVSVDIPPFMTGWGHAAVVLPVDNDAVLVVENADYRRDLVVCERVRHSRDLYDEAARAIVDAGLGEARLGIVGESYMPVAAWKAIRERVPAATFEPADEVLFRHRMLKSAAEVAMMRRASTVACEIQNAMLSLASAGRTDNDLVVEGLRTCCDHGAVPWEFAFASGPASGHGYWCRLPAWDRGRPYELGDLVHPDVYGCVDGYFYDLQRSLVVGGEPSARQRWLLDGVVGVVHALCAAARPGTSAAALAHLRHDWLGDYGYGEGGHATWTDQAGDLLDELVGCGHGIGVGFELPWIDPASPWTLETSMTIALEVYLSDPAVGTVAFEEVVLVTEDEPEILTSACPARWW